MSGPNVGVLIVPSASGRSDPFAEARRAEELGFDLVCLWDHPLGDHPSLETWTLLTWIAARTDRIALATDVLAVPFRLPALTAKMAETLDRLSGGRLILGLGGGGSDHEIAGLGAPARTPMEKVDGLGEASMSSAASGAGRRSRSRGSTTRSTPPRSSRSRRARSRSGSARTAGKAWSSPAAGRTGGSRPWGWERRRPARSCRGSTRSGLQRNAPAATPTSSRTPTTFASG